MHRPSVLIVDDHEGFRESARRMLEADGFDVVGTAVDGRSAITAAAALKPDVVVLDVQLPDLNGFDVAVAIAASVRPPVVVLTSSRSASAYADRLAGTPVHCYVPKHELSGQHLAALLA